LTKLVDQIKIVICKADKDGKILIINHFQVIQVNQLQIINHLICTTISASRKKNSASFKKLKNWTSKK